MSKQSGKSKNKMTGITALYCRLSRDDGTDRESNSISNQKEYVRVPCEQLRRYFPQNATPKQMQETLLLAMDFYRQHSRANTEREAR